MKFRQLFFFALIVVLVATVFGPATPAQAAGTYRCQLVAQSPADWTRMAPRLDFDAAWTLKNTGTANWKGVDLVYLGGAKMQKYASLYDVNTSVAPGAKIKFVIDMIAPKLPGTYTTYWGLKTGNQVFCRFYLTIQVR